MENDALLQLGLFLATPCLFAVCLTTHLTSEWYLRLLYALTFWCFTTLVFVRYVPQWTYNSVGILVILLAATSGVGAYVNYHLPYSSQATKDRINRWFSVGVIAAFLLVLCFWYFDNADKQFLRLELRSTKAQIDSVYRGQQEIKAKADRNAHKIDTVVAAVKGTSKRSDSLATADEHAQRDAEKAFNKKFKY